MKQAIEITEDNMLTWELQLKAEGTLPPEAQRLLLDYARDLEADVAHREEAHDAELSALEREQEIQISELEDELGARGDEVADLGNQVEELTDRITDLEAELAAAVTNIEA